MDNMFSKMEKDGSKAVWFEKGKWGISLQIGTDGDSAYVGIYNKEKTTKGGNAHDVVLGLNEKGPFLQVCDKEEYHCVELIPFVRFVSNMMKAVQPKDEL